MERCFSIDDHFTRAKEIAFPRGIFHRRLFLD
ncbi:hypothetical protein C357_23025 [Citreicella sp. 357]|nr:hypothetical protein C357_23025 [Citreicella sp. 357]